MLICSMTVQITQLTSLRPTSDAFCGHLRDALKAQLQSGQMKQMKLFVKTLYSEVIIPPSSSITDKEREDGSVIQPEGAGDDEAIEGEYLGGLGFTFKFPGDAKKQVSPLSFSLQQPFVMTC